MPLPKSEYLSEVWKDGIFGRFVFNSASEPLTDDNFLKSIKLFSVLVVQEQYTAPKSEH